MDATRALLDQLMGPNRNKIDGSDEPEAKWDDDKTCPYFLCGFCPHGLFKNTKEDLGSCPLLHSPALKEEFQKQPESTKNRYMVRYMRKLEGLLARGDARISRAKDRLELAPPPSDPQTVRHRKQISELEEQISELDKEVEELGEQGKVREAEEKLQKMEVLNNQLASVQEMMLQNVNKEEDKSDLKPLVVCDVCGGLIVNDTAGASKRLVAHNAGRMHQGYLKIREEVMKLRKWATEAEVTRDDGRSRSMERHRSSKGSRDRSRRREAGGSRERSRRRRSRERRDRSRRDRDRGRRRRDRSYDRSRRR